MMNNILQQIKQNPAAFLTQAKYNVPQGLTDSNDIIQYLLNTNQVSQAQVNRFANMRNNPMIQQFFNMK